MSLPDWLAAILPADTARTWETLDGALPDGTYLVGGTGLAVHLRHRVSRDLDFVHHRAELDPDAFARVLLELGPFAVIDRGPGTLNGVFSETRVHSSRPGSSAASSRQ